MNGAMLGTPIKLLPVACILLAAAQARGAEWEAGPPSSTLLFRAEHADMHTNAMEAFTGTFGDWSARISYDPARPEAATIHVRIALDSLDTGDPPLDREILGDDWFAAGDWPEATYRAEGFSSTGKDRFQAEGLLTLRGVEQPVVLAFELEILDDQAVAQGRAVIDRLAFGIGESAGPSLATVQVGVEFDLKATPVGGN